MLERSPVADAAPVSASGAVAANETAVGDGAGSCWNGGLGCAGGAVAASETAVGDGVGLGGRIPVTDREDVTVLSTIVATSGTVNAIARPIRRFITFSTHAYRNS